MNAKPQIHAKIADYAKTHMEAMNANARLDLQEEIAKQVGYWSSTLPGFLPGYIICHMPTYFKSVN